MSDWFSHALDLFFRRRPPLDALMWHSESIAAGESFTVPHGKIYEVFAWLAATQTLVDEDSKVVWSNYTSISGWVPIQGVRVGTRSDPLTYADITGEIGTAGSGDTALAIGNVITTPTVSSNYSFGRATHGWEFSEGQQLTSTAAFKVLWRDVTHRQ